MWDRKAVQRYEEWFATPHGEFAFAQEVKLISRLVSPWPRRGQKLLEIGCGPGKFLKVFWKAGFDVTGIDASPAMIEAAKRCIGDRSELFLGKAEHLPFDDNEFDFVALLTVLEFTDDPAIILKEAARVARKGLLVSFLNKYSLYYLSHGLSLPFVPRRSLHKARWLSYFSLKSLALSTFGYKPARTKSVLPGPKSTWIDKKPWRWLNGCVYCGPMGSYCAVRFDFVGQKPLNPLFSFTTEPGLSG